MPLRHLFIVYAVTLVWGFNFVAVATVLAFMPPLSFTLVRFLLVLLILAPFLRLPEAGQRLRLAAVCLLGGTLHFGFLFFALRLASDVSSVAILLQIYVPMAALMGVVALGETMGWRSALAIAVAFSGVLVVGFDPLVFSQLDSVAMAMGSAFCLALATVLMRNLSGVTPMGYQGWTALLSLPILIPLIEIFEPLALGQLGSLPGRAWAGIAYSALAASIIGHGLMFWLVQRHPVSTVAPHLLMAPIFGVTFGVLVWGDEPGPKLLVGGAMVLAGVLTVAVRSRHRARISQAR